MKICVLSINYYPELTGIAVYSTDMCEYLAQKGHEVVVVTGFPYYPQWEICEEYRGKIYLDEKRNSVLVRRCYLYVEKNISSLKRILHECSFILTSFFRVFFSPKPDLLFVVSPPLGLGVSGYLLGLIRRLPVVFHVQDLQPDAAIELGMIKKGGGAELLYKIEKFIYRKSTMVTTISRSMKNRIVAKGIESSKVVLFPNWSTLDAIGAEDEVCAFRREFDLVGKFVFLYSGNVGKKQGLEILVEASALLDESRAVVLIVGDGVNIIKLKQHAEKCNARNVRFLPLQPKSRLLTMLRAADVCLVIQKKGVSDIVFPSKMTNIMSAGCATVVTADKGTELAQAVYESASGYVAEPESVESLLGCMKDCFFDTDLSAKRRRAKQYAEKVFDKKAILESFDMFLKEVVCHRE